MVEGGTAHAKISMINWCVDGVPPALVYKGARGKAAGLGGGRAKGGVLLPPGVGLPLFLVGVGEEKERREERRKGGRRPLLVQFRLEGEGARGCPWLPSSSPTKAH